MDLEAEFTTEPFRAAADGEPPEHASRAAEQARKAGLDTTFGPLGTTVRGSADQVLAALPEIFRAALDGGATRVTLRLDAPNGEPNADHEESAPVGVGALDRAIAEVESEFGSPLSELSRADKQRAVRLLEERGAFEMRKSVPAVAEALGVTRFTVYNYLNRS
ncbi:helix-turn-helix domain-containing protein [Kutzneria sp. CA-103260]|uniref:helix-turn-helix domain-containing protein n=1 Tax=Kutzneria sp. CA-103260 TaxID=2802641 RepID=UPI001BABDBBB|nr:helix-turn-helix domain-containing protein [Kutzneria sp. CA-103260]QUQ65040.1 HTH domain protein [Kutzneria sp. CA-103260]